MLWSSQRLYYASASALGLAALAGVYVMASPQYVYVVGMLGVAHAVLASAGARIAKSHFIALEALLVALALGSVWLYALRLLPGTCGIGEAFRRILLADLSSRAGLGSLCAYVLGWGTLIGALGLVIANLLRSGHGPLRVRWQRGALALAAANVLFRFTLYDPIQEVGVWQPHGNESVVAAMAVGALIEPLVLFLLVLTAVANSRWRNAGPTSEGGFKALKSRVGT